LRKCAFFQCGADMCPRSLCGDNKPFVSAGEDLVNEEKP
jgi:hypothetical protein